MIKKIDRNVMRKKRHYRIRKKVNGTAETPRLNVFRSNKNISAQIIDDMSGNTLVSYSTLAKDYKGESKSNVEAAKAVGTKIAELAKLAGIETVVFDRGGYLYHGKVKALAESAREAGLKF